MKPFDLQKALAGEPVITRIGKPVTQITKFDANETGYCVVAVVDGGIETFSIDGKFRIEDTTEYDLFMATKTVKKEGWVALWKSDTGGVYATGIYTKEELADIPNIFFKKINEVKIEWEEEI